ncbi:MAG TPA: glycosyltransferase family 4 protein [Planctomycetota bacterium]|jgi:glycosyltransferase involved in cell wall biosynthesis
MNHEPKTPNRIRLLVIGPTPPPYHGVATFIADLLSAREPRFAIRHLDTSDRRGSDNMGRWDARNLALGFSNLAQLAAACRETDVVYVPISQNVAAFLRDALFIVQARAWGCRVVVHLHGGHFRKLYDSESGPVFRLVARLALKAASAVLVLGEEFVPIFSGLVRPERIHVVPNGVPDCGAWALREDECTLLAEPLAPVKWDAGGGDLGRADAETGLRRDEAATAAQAGGRGETATGAEGTAGDAVPKHGGTILFMSTLTRTKGIFELIQAVRLLRPHRPLIRLLIAGQWADADLRQEAEEYIKREELEDSLSFCGVVNGEAKASFLARGHVFCLPTRYPYEGQPLVLLEAMASGLPIVATQHAAIPSTVTDGVVGRLVPKDCQPQQLANVLDELLSNPTQLQRYSAAARERYLEHYTLSACHERLFRAIMGAVSQT